MLEHSQAARGGGIVAEEQAYLWCKQLVPEAGRPGAGPEEPGRSLAGIAAPNWSERASDERRSCYLTVFIRDRERTLTYTPWPSFSLYRLSW